LQMIADSSYTAVGRELGVSDNAIRKHLRQGERP
jgi:predicted ArsR family transcriptional regulator